MTECVFCTCIEVNGKQPVQRKLPNGYYYICETCHEALEFTGLLDGDSVA